LAEFVSFEIWTNTDELVLFEI